MKNAREGVVLAILRWRGRNSALLALLVLLTLLLLGLLLLLIIRLEALKWSQHEEDEDTGDYSEGGRTSVIAKEYE